MLDPIVIAAIFTIIGNIVINLFQFRNFISQAKEKESLAASTLIERALEVSKEEVSSLRAINSDLLKKISEKNEEIAQLKDEICSLEKKIKDLEIKCLGG